MYGTFPAAKAAIDEADATLGFSLSALMFQGDSHELTLTMNAQPAILTVSVALLRVLEQEYGFHIADRCAYAMGHSLGEYTALVAAGALSLADALRLVRRRGLAMHDVVSHREQPTAMTALMLHGASVSDIQRNLSSIQLTLPAGDVAELANINSSRQVVLSGTEAGVGAAVQELQARRLAARAIDLPVSAPFHCSLMRPAAKVMKEALKSVQFTPLQLPIISNVTAAPITNHTQFPDLLVQQVTHTVAWAPSVSYCQRNGIVHFISVGPGKVLANLLKREHPKDKIIPVTNVEELREFNSTF
ncbi:[acyl-carrier-protein] S-malonyltransferase [Dimargaris verticillata]|uniref:[acyl-carrier-protein] S-malonyltransferase n=1 Tax=Dimargaris verticillata TaxID=2761393 RepID=A0A9W8B8B6_9FUNG|nr:[acyl-carrier-protein] S-malonyltransferase [Dimargaris verticillata]